MVIVKAEVATELPVEKALQKGKGKKKMGSGT